MVDGIFTYSPDPLPPDLDPSHDLITQNGEAMYALGQLSDLETWLEDCPEKRGKELIIRTTEPRRSNGKVHPRRRQNEEI